MNSIDLVFLLFVGFYAMRGFQRGLVREGLDFAGFFFGIALAVRLYFIPSALFRVAGVPQGWSHVIGGAIIFAASVVGFAFLAKRIHKSKHSALTTQGFRIGGAVFASMWSALFASFVIVVLTVLPASAAMHQSVGDSLVGRTVLSSGSPIYPVMETYARKEARNALFFLRQYFVQLEPQKSSTAEGEDLFEFDPTSDIQLDPAAETAIFNLVNNERKSRGLSILKVHFQIRRVARAHSTDMYQKGYFAHRNRDGKDPFDRMADGSVVFTFAGENLAMAPTVDLVHQGLMNSPGHKKNILSPDFTDLGIGVYKGSYGLMVTQNFCAGCT